MNLPSNLADLSRDDLRQLANVAVNEVQTDTGLDFAAAWKKAKLLYKPLFDAMQSKADAATDDAQQDQAKATALQNDAVGQSLAGASQATNELKLPPDCTVRELAVAMKANGNQFANVDYVATFDAEVQNILDATGCSFAEASAAAAARFPILKNYADEWRKYQQSKANVPTADQPGGTPAPMPAPAALATPAAPDFTRAPNFNKGGKGLNVFKGARAALGNDGPAGVMTPENIQNLGLPKDVDPETFQAAFAANDNSHAPRQSGKILSGLADHLVKKGKADPRFSFAVAAHKFPTLAGDLGIPTTPTIPPGCPPLT